MVTGSNATLAVTYAMLTATALVATMDETAADGPRKYQDLLHCAILSVPLWNQEGRTDSTGTMLPTPIRVQVKLDPPFKAGEKSYQIVPDMPHS